MRNLLFLGLSLALYTVTTVAQPGPVPISSSIHTLTLGGAKVKTDSRYNGTKAAQAAVKEGDKAQLSGDIDRAVRGYRKAISLDPNYAEAQKKYTFNRVGEYFVKLLNASVELTPKVMADVNKHQESISKKLIRKYESLAEQHPDSPVYPWVLGQLVNETDLDRQESLCQKAVQIDKNFARGWECLSHIAMLRINEEKALAYLRRAMNILPEDEDIASRYAYRLASSGDGYDSEIRALLRRFPKSHTIAMAVVTSAKNLQPKAARIAALEKLRRDPPLSSRSVAFWAAQSLYPIYLTDNLRKARNLTHDVTGSKGELNKRWVKVWVQREIFVEGLIKAQHEIDAGHALSALASLKAVHEKADRLDGAVSENQWYLMEARALDAAGRTADAIAKLCDGFVSQPSDAVLEAMVSYGAKIGKSKAEINDVVWTALKAKAKPAHPFTLKRLDNQQPVSLSDYRGKVVIADFWYPNCGPCRASFPYLDKVAVKFQDKGLTVFAINSIQKQQPFALPYLRGKGYHFIGLAANKKFAHKTYGVIGFPTTFFIGPDGNILFQIHLSDDASEHSAEAAVKFMLTRAKQA